MEKDGACKMDRQKKVKNAVVLERVVEGRIMLELIRKRKKKKKLLGHCIRKNKLPAEGCSRTRVRKSGTLCPCSVT